LTVAVILYKEDEKKTMTDIEFEEFIEAFLLEDKKITGKVYLLYLFA
jgi:hypothetical protein